jgi:hypothetical protein
VRARRGVDLARVHQLRSRVLEVLARTDRAPHRVVLVIDDAEAYAGSWYADAGDAHDPQWATYCRDMAARAVAAGAGEAVMDEVQTDRTAALLLVARLRTDGDRPGSAWRVEPDDDGGQG